MTLKELALKEEMTQRSINVCIYSDISTLSDLLRYKSSHLNFLELRNCGQKSNLELLKICDKYHELKQDGEIEIINESNDNEIYIVPQKITTVYLDENMDLRTLALSENMSVRSFNTCLKAGLTSLRLVLQYYVDNKKKQFLAIYGCGINSNNELIRICKKYESSIKFISTDDSVIDDKFSPLEYFINDLRLDKLNYNNVRSIVFENKIFPVFSVINSLIESNYIFKNSNNTFVFKNVFHCYIRNEEHTLEEIGKMLGFTRERARQIRNKNLRKLPRVFHFIKDIHYKVDCPEYIHNLGNPIVLITEEDAFKINKQENTNFSPFFISFILSIIYSKDYYWLGDRQNFFKSNSPKVRLINYPFLINKAISSKNKFEKLWKHVYKLIHEIRFDDEFVKFDALIKVFSAQNSEDQCKVISVISTFLEIEFRNQIGILPDGIILNKNKEKSTLMLIIEILQNSYKPLHFSEIFDILKKKEIRVNSSQYVHSILVRENKIFGIKGAGTYDLRCKGGLFGSIGDVAEQILVKRKTPIQLKELENIICSELIVSKDSIRNNLFCYEGENRFKRLKNGLVGLTRW